MIAIISSASRCVYRSAVNIREVIMSRMLITAALSGAIALAGGIAWAQHPGPHPGQNPGQNHGQMDHKAHDAGAGDTRQLVNFPPELTAHTIANMRDHLLALQEITDALGRGEGSKAAKVAEARLGMSSLELHGAHEVAKYMPQGMQEAGTAMHRAASRFALKAQDAGVTGDVKPALNALSDVMGACVTCHAAYRLK
jgi:hypothetical protein